MSLASVCIIVPFYNSHAHLKGLLDTIFAQHGVDWRLILVDDASSQPLTITDDHRLRSPKIRILRHEQNGGPAAARNTGLDHAHSSFVAFLDADDYWHPRKLLAQVTAAQARQDPQNVFCVTATALRYSGGMLRVKPSRPKHIQERADEYIYVAGEFAQSSSFFLGARLAGSIRFRDLRLYEDHLFFIEALNSGADYCLVDEVLTTYADEYTGSRASTSDTFARSVAFLDQARSLLSERAELAFRVRYLGADLVAKRPVEATLLLVRAFRKRAIKPRYAASFVLRTVMPKSSYRWLRQSVRSTRDLRA